MEEEAFRPDFIHQRLLMLEAWGAWEDGERCVSAAVLNLFLIRDEFIVSKVAYEIPLLVCYTREQVEADVAAEELEHGRRWPDRF